MEDFILKYEDALASQQWINISPLIAEDACVVFSDGSIHQGKAQIKIAFERNFKIIKNEHYEIKNICWIKKEENFGVYLFDFYWTGFIDGESYSGNGMGTSVLMKMEEKWCLLSEHLAKKV